MAGSITSVKAKIEEAGSKIPHNTQHFVAGISGGLGSTVALYPLELLKIRMQVIEGSTSPYRSLYGSFSTVLRQEGFKGFYNGVTPAIIASAASWGGFFYFYEYCKAMKLHGGKSETGVFDHLLSATQAGVIMVLMTNPLWLIKTRMALQGTTPHATQYTGVTDAVSKIVREEGFLGLYKGIVPALFLTSHGAIQFASYEFMKSCMKAFSTDDSQSPLVSMITGGSSKIIASTATYPYQVIKSRLQINTSAASGDALGGVIHKYNGFLDCVVKIWRNEGAIGYFRGVVPNALKVTPASAVTFLVYEETKKMLKTL